MRTVLPNWANKLLKGISANQALKTGLILVVKIHTFEDSPAHSTLIILVLDPRP